RARRHRVSRDGTARRRDARGPVEKGRAATGSGASGRDSHRGRARRRSPPRHRPSRSETRQRDVDQDGHEAPRLRARENGRGRRGRRPLDAPDDAAPADGARDILGTFQYMAPEQIEGQEADARSDIFAFGCIVYELLTRRKAFEGKSPASLIGAILKDPAPRISAAIPG